MKVNQILKTIKKLQLYIFAPIFFLRAQMCPSLTLQAAARAARSFHAN
jgi:hypothetical protein